MSARMTKVLSSDFQYAAPRYLFLQLIARIDSSTLSSTPGGSSIPGDTDGICEVFWLTTCGEYAG